MTQYTPSHAYNMHVTQEIGPHTEFENKVPLPSTPSPSLMLNTCEASPPTTFTTTAHLPPPLFSMTEAILMDDSLGPLATNKWHKVHNHHTDFGHASSKFLISHLSSPFLTTQFQIQVARPSLGRHLHPGWRPHLSLGARDTPKVQARPKDWLQ